MAHSFASLGIHRLRLGFTMGGLPWFVNTLGGFTMGLPVSPRLTKHGKDPNVLLGAFRNFNRNSSLFVAGCSVN